MVLIVGAERLHAGGATDTSGRVTDPQGLAIPNARVALVHRGDSGTRETRTDEQGAFFFRAVPAGMYTITAQAGAFKTVSKTLETTAAGANIVSMRFGQISAGHESLVIVSSALDPVIDLRNSDVYKKTLFERDDQRLESLGARGLMRGSTRVGIVERP
jgi:hypothetical protein